MTILLKIPKKSSINAILAALLLALILQAMILVAAAVDTGTSATGNGGSKVAWTVNDTFKVAGISAVDVSPDGKRVAYAVKRAVMTPDKSEYQSQIYLADIDGNNTTQLTQGDSSNNNPQWSPDGKQIAFTSTRSGKPEIWAIPVDGGEAVQVTDVDTGADAFKWSPDGKSIGFLTQDNQTKEQKRAVEEKDDPQVIDKDVYVWGQSMSMTHIWLAEKNSSGRYEARRLTGGNFNVFDWDWSPDGKSIAFSYGSGPALQQELQSNISRVDLETGKIVPLMGAEANAETSEYGPRYSPDGLKIAYCVAPSQFLVKKVQVRLIPSNGGKSEPLADVDDLYTGVFSPIGWSKDGDELYFLIPKGTKQEIIALPANGSRPREIFEGGQIENAKLNHDRSMLGFEMDNSLEPPEAYVSRTDDIRPVKVSDLNEGLPIQGLGKTDAISWNSTDGWKIEGLLTYPAGYQPGKKYPLLLMIHGGPTGAFTQSFIGINDFLPDLPLYPLGAFSSQGYAVLRCNPRGSTGNGTVFRMANMGDLGGMDRRDILAGVDHVVAMGIADPNRLGVMGWSYGGYMTSFLITQTNRFKAASVGAGPVDWISMMGTCDSPDAFPKLIGSRFWNNYSLYTSMSSIFHIQNVTTPTLIQHGSEDVTVPTSQARELYSALKTRGVTTKLVIYPRTAHIPKEPKLFRDIMNENQEWFNKYVPVND